jgi:hypothetical protein
MLYPACESNPLVIDLFSLSEDVPTRRSPRGFASHARAQLSAAARITSARLRILITIDPGHLYSPKLGVPSLYNPAIRAGTRSARSAFALLPTSGDPVLVRHTVITHAQPTSSYDTPAPPTPAAFSNRAPIPRKQTRRACELDRGVLSRTAAPAAGENVRVLAAGPARYALRSGPLLSARVDALLRAPRADSGTQG